MQEKYRGRAQKIEADQCVSGGVCIKIEMYLIDALMI
jgi:hypothetical protein